MIVKEKLTAENIILISYSDRGIIDKNTMLTTLQIMTKKELEKAYSIKQTKNSSGQIQYYVYVKDEVGKRKQLRGATYEIVFDKLSAYVRKSEHIEKLILDDLYVEWLEYKTSITNSKNTIKIHKCHYKKYFENTKLFDMDIHKVDKIMLQTFCNQLIKTKNINEADKQEPMTRKEWVNVKTILNGMFEYAVDKGYLDSNPLERVKITVKFKQVNKKTAKTEIYNTEEYEALHNWLDKMFSETGDTIYLAVKFQSFTGLRVGELVALKWEDIVDNVYLHVVREETRDMETNIYSVVEHTKTNQDRIVKLASKALEVLGKVKVVSTDTGYIFQRDGKRFVAHQISHILTKYARKEGVRVKSSHKLRKTYASRLSDANVPRDHIRTLLGHTTLATTDLYIFSSFTDSETNSLIEQAL